LETFMGFQRQVSHALDEEHRANLELLGRVEQALARAPRSGAGRDPELLRLVGSFGRHIEQDISRHFDFEESELFPRMAEAGDGDMAALMQEEHTAIRAVAAELLPLARAAAAGTLDDAGWDALKRGALEMVERQVAHIQKETMALLPLLDDLLDDESDRELAFAYAAA
jgi:hemerythrin-like domain-containing protein